MGRTNDCDPFVNMKLSWDSGLAIPASLRRQVHNYRALLHNTNHLQRLTRQQNDASCGGIDRTCLVGNQFWSRSPRYESLKEVIS
jgi:hypothetical protein